ncbi:hypothetical protein [Pedobacter jamesrossensis]|uniref:Uncharacterized protein n=1 Tax=Pedobacter jamesrossensis TaxID=1908238 RepID=A0ABV8NGF4_9SPHI
MKKILKATGFGIVLGATAFFIPFIFKFILIAMVIGMVFRMFAHSKRRHFMHRFEMYQNNNHFSQITPIDNQWYTPTVERNSPVQNINVNY